MLRKLTSVLTATLLVFGALALGGCDKTKDTQEPDFSNAKQVAELATYECYTHNVAKRIDPALIWNIGGREAWFEYDAIVTYGIDANKVEIGKPHLVGNKLVVTVKIPKAQVFGRPALVTDSIKMSGEKRGILVFTNMTADQQKEVITNAQNDLEKKAGEDEAMLEQAQSRGKDLIASYITNVGDALGQTYEVEFETI